MRYNLPSRSLGRFRAAFFRMGSTKSLVPAFGQQLIIAYNHAAYHGVGPGLEPASLGQFQGPAHPALMAG